MNKKAEAGGLSLKKIITLVLIALILVLVLLSIFLWNVPGKLRDIFPDFNQTLQDNEVVNLVDLQEQQKNIPHGEKSLNCDRPYKEIKMFYYKGDNDEFKFRYNDYLKRFQIYVNLNEKYGSEEWLIHPDLFEMFKENKKMYADEIGQVKYLINADNEEEFAKKLEKVSEDKNWVVYLDNKKLKVNDEEVLEYLDNSKEKENFEKNKDLLKQRHPECFDK